MNKQQFHIGIPTILMIVFSLCLFIFCILSFTSSYSDYKLSQKMLDRTDNYYACCNLMQEHLQELNSNLSESSLTQTFTYEEPLNDDQLLHVEVVPQKRDSEIRLRITCWKLIPAKETVYDEHLHVIP